MDSESKTQGYYQEALRTIGTLLDVRGLIDVRIVESAGEFEIAARPARSLPVGEFELMRFDRDQMNRLIAAARSDRGRLAGRKSPASS